MSTTNGARDTNNSLYYTGFSGGWATAPKRENNSKFKDVMSDPLKLALIIATLALLISLVATLMIATIVTGRIERMEEYPKTYGITNVNNTYSPGGYYGWYYRSSYPDLYPLADLHVSLGDSIFFTSRMTTSEDLWLVPPEVYESCNFTNQTDQIQLAVNNFLRGGTFTRNETCDLVEDEGCQGGGWIINRYPYNELGGFTFLVQNWHVRQWGNPLYFASAREWDRWGSSNQGCRNGIKLRVFVEPRAAIPFLEDDGSAFDISTTETVQDLMASIGHLSRMLILSQFNAEQRVRSEGDSGLTQVRGSYDGDAAYDDGTFTNGAVASIHDHSDNIIVVGIGEIQAVLNGVEFVTRHNDYNLNMPSETESTYGKTQPIPYPNVPPQVTSAGNVNNQIKEMQEWFRAFKTQNKSHRNYTNYFKPILCYLEGTWIIDTDVLDEPFDSDRHAIDARTWKQLHDKIRWMLNSGRKNSLENLAHLPSAIRGLVNDTFPIISNWEYRILCAPLKNDIPTSRFRIVNDLSVQLMGSPQTRDELEYSRRARFELNRYIDINDPDGKHRWSEGRKRWNYLDYLMEQIPGKDNYGANLTDVLPDGSDISIHYNTDKTLNSAYYSRFFGLSGADAMGSSKHRRGWSDRNFFAAQTTAERVSPVDFNFEQEDEDGKIKYIQTISRWSYAIPLEIIYQTPLSKWNPHNIKEMDRNDYDYSRSGACDDSNTAFNGWTINNAYFTPAAFYEGLTVTSSADTASDNVCANGDGGFFPVYASGHWITFPEIGNGIGKIRQRYPIFPIHGVGSPAFKEVKALQAVVLDVDYDDPITHPDGFFGDDRDVIYGFEVNLQGGGHQHVMYIPGWKVRNYWRDNNNNWLMSANDVAEIESDTRNNHAHTVTVWRDQDTNGVWVYHIKACRFGSLSDDDQYTIGDWEDAKCIDNHDAIGRE